MKIGFIGLGNVGGKLAGSLFRNKFDLTVYDLDKSVADEFKSKGVNVSNYYMSALSKNLFGSYA